MCEALAAWVRDPKNTKDIDGLLEACERCGDVVFGDGLGACLGEVREAVKIFRSAKTDAERAAPLRAVIHAVDCVLLPEYDRKTGCGR